MSGRWRGRRWEKYKRPTRRHALKLRGQRALFAAENEAVSVIFSNEYRHLAV